MVSCCGPAARRGPSKAAEVVDRKSVRVSFATKASLRLTEFWYAEASVNFGGSHKCKNQFPISAIYHKRPQIWFQVCANFVRYLTIGIFAQEKATIRSLVPLQFSIRAR